MSIIYGARRYRALASLVVVRHEVLDGWADAYVYKGEFLPSTSDPFQVEQLLKDGAIETFGETAA